jgi:electron transport complex protein RnfC
VTIKVDGDEWEPSINSTQEIIKDITLSSSEIIEKILKSGVVGLGGATFPTHIKLKIPEEKNVNTLIINGVECEPYLTSDHRLMLERGEEILVGIKVLMKALNVKKAMIGVENNKKDAIESLEKLIKSNESDYNGISVHALKVKYPQGGEKQLIKALLNLEVPSGGLPLDVGCVVQNIATAFATYEAIQKNKPLVSRIVTVTGKSLKTPSNFLSRIGIPISHLIEQAGGLPEDTAKVINGGPMMGKSLNSLEAPIVKGTSGILILKESESQRNKIKNCIRCAKCVSVCPMGLEPYLIESLVQRRLYDNTKSEHIMDCIECGSCSFACPADRALLDYIRLGKIKIREKK